MSAYTSAYKWYLPTLGEIIALSEPSSRRADARSRGAMGTKKASLSQDAGFQPRSRESFRTSPIDAIAQAQHEWYAAVAGLNDLLADFLETIPTLASDNNSSPVEGLIISGPLPVLGRSELIHRFSSWTLTGSGGISQTLRSAFQLLPAAELATVTDRPTASLPLLPDDPLGAEPFCLVLTSEFSLVLTLTTVGHEHQYSASQFLFSFTPEVVWQGWRSLRSRLEITAPHSVSQLDAQVEQFAPVTPDYRLVADFSRLMLVHLSESAFAQHHFPSRTASSGQPAQPQQRSGKKLLNLNLPYELKPDSSRWRPSASKRPILNVNGDGKQHMVDMSTDVLTDTDESLEPLDAPPTAVDTELLRAIAHEVRTPLTTIRTLIRLLLRRADLPAVVTQRLEMIDRECTKQIDRFGLIFRAVELETKAPDSPLSPLAKISPMQVLKQNIPRWQQQAEQHNLTLNVKLPASLPMVLSDPTMLDQVLTGLIDQLTHVLPAGSLIELRVMPVGNQLKLQLYSSPQGIDVEDADSRPTCPIPMQKDHSIFSSTLKSVGQLLMFQPETGNLSLNLDVTKNLFHALGGKFTIRQYPQQGEVLTIFLPLDETGFMS